MSFNANFRPNVATNPKHILGKPICLTCIPYLHGRATKENARTLPSFVIRLSIIISRDILKFFIVFDNLI